MTGRGPASTSWSPCCSPATSTCTRIAGECPRRSRPPRQPGFAGRRVRRRGSRGRRQFWPLEQVAGPVRAQAVSSEIDGQAAPTRTHQQDWHAARVELWLGAVLDPEARGVLCEVQVAPHRRVARLGATMTGRAHQGAVRWTVDHGVLASSGASGCAMLDLAVVLPEPLRARFALRLEDVPAPGPLADEELDLRAELGRLGRRELAGTARPPRRVLGPR